jgi:hypothetical protein
MRVGTAFQKIGMHALGNGVPKNDTSSLEMLKALGLSVEALSFFWFSPHPLPQQTRRGNLMLWRSKKIGNVVGEVVLENLKWLCSV